MFYNDLSIYLLLISKKPKKKKRKGDVYASLLDCQVSMRLVHQYFNSSNPRRILQLNETDDMDETSYESILSYLYLSTLLLAIRCSYLLKWFGVCRELLKRAIEIFGLFDAKTAIKTIHHTSYRHLFVRLYLKLVHKLRKSKNQSSTTNLTESNCPKGLVFFNCIS